MQFDIISNVCCTLNAVNSFLLDNMFPLMQSLKTKNKRGKLPQNCRSFLYTYIYILFLLISVLPPDLFKCQFCDITFVIIYSIT